MQFELLDGKNMSDGEYSPFKMQRILNYIGNFIYSFDEKFILSIQESIISIFGKHIFHINLLTGLEIPQIQLQNMFQKHSVKKQTGEEWKIKYMIIIT